ncbi:hypothetical protein PEC106664_05240 [Pectobacterium carotovorum subsp. carotovorum]|nr:hypothetical protein PEC106664_05240 [Pectobacterium carotovorum subsp. carotovorum]
MNVKILDTLFQHIETTALYFPLHQKINYLHHQRFIYLTH